MKKKMKGNDLRFNWSVKDGDGNPFSVEEKDLTLVLRGPHGAVPVGDVTFEDNVVSFTFFGKDQKDFGIYTAVLIENAGNALMKTVDFVGAVELVAHTIQEGGSTGSQLSIDTVDLESTLVVGIPGPRGFSIYEFAVKYMGFEGTEREFWEWFKAAKDAADTAAGNAAAAQSRIEESERARAAEFIRLCRLIEQAVANADALVDRLRTFPTVFVDVLPEASAETLYSFYLVPNPLDPSVKDIYLTEKKEDGTYGWRKVGGTNIAFNEYMRKDDIILLTEDEYDALREKDPTKWYLTYEDTGEEEE